MRGFHVETLTINSCDKGTILESRVKRQVNEKNTIPTVHDDPIRHGLVTVLSFSYWKRHKIEVLETSSTLHSVQQSLPKPYVTKDSRLLSTPCIGVNTESLRSFTQLTLQH